MKEKVREKIMMTILSQTLRSLLLKPWARHHGVFKREKTKEHWNTPFDFVCLRGADFGVVGV